MGIYIRKKSTGREGNANRIIIGLLLCDKQRNMKCVTGRCKTCEESWLFRDKSFSKKKRVDAESTWYIEPLMVEMMMSCRPSAHPYIIKI